MHINMYINSAKHYIRIFYMLQIMKAIEPRDVMKAKHSKALISAFKTVFKYIANTDA